MDQIRSAINSLTGSNNGQNAQQTAPGTSGGGNFLGGNNGQNLQHTGQGITGGGGRLGSNEYSQQNAQGTSGNGSYAGGMGSNGSPQETAHQQTTQGAPGNGGFLAGLGNKLNAAAGGGPESEKNEDLLDKGVDFVQEKFLGQGPQNNESAMEQMKDEQISDFIRKQYKSTTGHDFPIKDKS